MPAPSPAELSFTEADLDFVVGAAAPGSKDTERLKALVRHDPDFRKAMVGDERVFRRVMGDDEVFLKVSPALYFEVLLRRALRELAVATHTVERAGTQSIPVFDTLNVLKLMSRAGVLEYLAQMLASFTRIHSYVVPVRVRRGVRRRVRFNDMDVDSLIRFCAAADESQRFGFYKRIADLCLFVTGMFPGHTFLGYQRSGPDLPRPLAIRTRRSLEEYETEGRRFYGLAGEHPTARTLQLAEVFGLLREHFSSVRKPLSFIASRYLHSHRHQLFGLQR